MSIRRRDLLVLGFLALVAWLAYDPCYCWWAQWKWEPWDAPLHLRALPEGCEVLALPGPWRTPEGEEIWTVSNYMEGGEVFDELEIRRIQCVPDRVLLALRSRALENFMQVTPRNSKQKYAFQFPALAGHPEQKLSGVREISEAEWNSGKPEALVSGDSGWRDGSDKPQIQGNAIVYRQKIFAKSERHFFWFFPALASAGRRRIAVLSYGPWEITTGSGALGINLTPPWRRYTADFYSVSNGAAIRRVRSWTCQASDFEEAQWHGDDIFTLPLERGAERVLICGFR